MPKNRRRKQTQNIESPGVEDARGTILVSTEVANPEDMPPSVEATVPEVGESLLAHNNGDTLAMDTAAAPAWTAEPVIQVYGAPSLRTISGLVTLEVLLYVVIGIVALSLRVVNLDARPLASGEAQTAAAAWEFLNGKPVGEYVSPLLFTLDWIAFFLFGAFDLTARFLPAVLGATLVLLPLLLRKVLGKTGAIAAALLIAFSPTLVFFGRTLSGADLSVGGALAALIFFWNYSESGKVRHLYAAAVLAALSLTTDAAAFTVLVIGAGYFAVILLVARRGAAETELAKVKDEVTALQNPLVRAVLFFAATYILSATTFLLNRDGLGVAFNLLGDWLDGFSLIGNFSSPLNWLLVYEPLPLIFGVAAVVLVLTARREEARSVGLLWVFALIALGSLVWYSLAGNKAPSVVVTVGMPLMLLAGWFVGNLLERARSDIAATGGWSSLRAGEIPVFVMLMVLAALVYLQVVTFLQQTRFSPALDELYKLFNVNAAEGSLVAAAITLTVISLLLLGVLIGLSLLLVGAARTTTLLAFAILVLLALGTVRATWLLNFSEDEPVRELLAPVQTPQQIRDLVRDIEFYSEARKGDPHVMQVGADPELGAAARWYLRVFPNLTWTQNIDSLRNAGAIVTPSESPPPGNWMGQRYRVSVDWEPSSLGGIELWKWFVFREGGDETWQTTMLWMPTQAQ